MKSKFNLCILFSIILISNQIAAGPIDTKILVRNSSNANYMDNNSDCSIDFSLIARGSLDNVEHIYFHSILKNKKNEIILKQISKSYGFVEVGGKYFGSFFIDDEGACAGFGGVVDITKAIVTYKDGTKPEDIIKTKKLIIDNFKPVKINIGSK